MFDYTWLITVIAIIGAVANARKKRCGFALWIISNGYLCVYDLWLGLYPQALLYAAFLLISIHGLAHWTEKPSNKAVGQVFVFIGMFQGLNDKIKVYSNTRDAEAAWSSYTGVDYSEFERDDSILDGTKYEGSTIFLSEMKGDAI